MEYIEFLKLVENKQYAARERTLRFWHVIYVWIAQNGYADTADTPDFVRHMKAFRSTTTATLNKHLRLMSSAGILKAHTLRRKLGREEKELFFNPFLTMFSGNPLPSSFIRYCIPGQECSLEFKSAQRLTKNIEKQFMEVREHAYEQKDVR